MIIWRQNRILSAVQLFQKNSNTWSFWEYARTNYTNNVIFNMINTERVPLEAGYCPQG